ncbi:MAG: hypothetical protein KKA19_08570 [Candidatus Margulisbacteria bacterium]|nr:hypothetical protein [Candidatus Margulisiibacteriota bacterium]
MNDFAQEIKANLIILDEAHNIKNPVTQQSRAARSLNSEHKIALSATPTANGAEDLWPLLQFLNHPLTKEFSFRKFKSFFCESSYGRYLLSKELDKIMFRHRKEEIDNLPEKNFQRLKCQMNPQEWQEYVKRRDEFEKWFIEYKTISETELKQLVPTIRKNPNIIHMFFKKLPSGKLILKKDPKDLKLKAKNIFENEEEYKVFEKILNRLIPSGVEVLQQIQKLRFGTIDANTKLSQSIPSAKYEALFSLIEEKIKKKEQIVIFAEWQDIIGKVKAEIQEKYGQDIVATLYGKDPAAARDQVINDFKKGKKSKNQIVIASYGVGAESIELSTAKNVILLHEPWSYIKFDQAISRVWRFAEEETREKVNVYSLMAIGPDSAEGELRTIDYYVSMIIDKKRSVALQVIDKFFDWEFGQEEDDDAESKLLLDELEKDLFFGLNKSQDKKITSFSDSDKNPPADKTEALKIDKAAQAAPVKTSNESSKITLSSLKDDLHRTHTAKEFQQELDKLILDLSKYLEIEYQKYPNQPLRYGKLILKLKPGCLIDEATVKKCADLNSRLKLRVDNLNNPTRFSSLEEYAKEVTMQTGLLYVLQNNRSNMTIVGYEPSLIFRDLSKKIFALWKKQKKNH